MNFSALLLVGGLSTRMGRDKATLVIDRQPLWAAQIAVLRELQPVAIFISARRVPVWAPADVHVIVDNPPSRGPLSGIATALMRLETSHLLALAVDLPGMTAEHLRKLLGYISPGCGVISRNRERLEPLSAIYPKEAAALALRCLNLPDVSMLSFVRKLLIQGQLREYPLGDEEAVFYRNINSPEDLRN